MLSCSVGEVSVEVGLCRLNRFMAEPKGNDRAVDASLEKFHRCTVAPMSFKT